jgi:hypothetical protein
VNTGLFLVEQGHNLLMNKASRKEIKARTTPYVNMAQVADLLHYPGTKDPHKDLMRHVYDLMATTISNSGDGTLHKALVMTSMMGRDADFRAVCRFIFQHGGQAIPCTAWGTMDAINAWKIESAKRSLGTVRDSLEWLVDFGLLMRCGHFYKRTNNDGERIADPADFTVFLIALLNTGGLPSYIRLGEDSDFTLIEDFRPPYITEESVLKAAEDISAKHLNGQASLTLQPRGLTATWRPKGVSQCA